MVVQKMLVVTDTSFFKVLVILSPIAVGVLPVPIWKVAVVKTLVIPLLLFPSMPESLTLISVNQKLLVTVLILINAGTLFT